MKKSYSMKDMAIEAISGFPKFAKLNDRQKAKAAAMFTQKLLSADVNSPLSQEDAKKFLKKMLRAARAVK